MIPKAQVEKSENKEVKLHWTKKHSKGNNQQDEKASYTVGETVCKPYIQQATNIQNT